MSDLKVIDGDDTVEFQLRGSLDREFALREAWHTSLEHVKELQQRLTAGAQRNAELVELLRMAWGNDDISAVDCRRIDVACTKPTESGAN